MSTCNFSNGLTDKNHELHTYLHMSAELEYASRAQNLLQVFIL